MENKKYRVAAALITAAVLTAVSGCSSPGTSGGAQTEAESTAAGNSLPEAEKHQEADEVPEEKRKLLETMTAAIESQFSQETFTDIPIDETEEAVSKFKESYALSGRRSSLGKEYIAGVSLRDENPLEGMNCRSDGKPSEYVTSQFADGRFILMEKAGGEGGGFSELYDILQTGESGLSYMLDVAQRQNTLVMPEETPFVRVYMVKGTVPAAEYIPLTQEEYTVIKEGKTAEMQDGTAGTLLLCERKEDVQKLWTDSAPAVTEETLRLAQERCGYSADALSQEPVVKASMTLRAHGETREETLGNREDIDRLQEILQKITPQTDFLSSPAGSYDGTITLTGQDNTVQTLHIGLQGGACVLGTSWFGMLPEDDAAEVLKLFSTIDGWNRYGGEISIRIDDAAHTEEDQSIAFTLENGTGGPIDYILSPIFYKKEGDSWVMLESIAGFCGVSDRMEEEEKELSVPWKGAFETRGEGLYKLEIQVAPEEGLRFAVSDTFVVKK